jgi:hypothetical protein
MEESGRSLISRVSSAFTCRDCTENLSQDSQSPGRDLNLRPPEYEAGKRSSSIYDLW